MIASGDQLEFSPEVTMEPNDRFIAKKEAWAEAKRGLTEEGVPPDLRTRHNRLPPGQHITKGWPVLDLGVHPDVALTDWTLTIGGLVQEKVLWSWPQFLEQPHFRSTSDFHCVTTWSTFDNRWEGISFKHILSIVRPLPQVRFVLFSSYDGYTTNLPLEACDDDDVLLTYMWNDQPLPKEHGGPVRVIVPKRYAWKGAKWVKAITFAERDAPGFWEVRGYSQTGLPWEEDRYG
jgi:DMSO/TMAO reductase YedYZ molybdopterin-dependent catalytic subunit